MASDASKSVHIALAVVRNSTGDVLLARRPEDKHQGGLWEFPGGKVEADETVRQALARELHEEVGIVPVEAQPLIQIRHDYPELSVLLDCWEVTEFSGSAYGREGQPICWERPEQLDHYPFPAANGALIKAVQLPKRYWITPDGSAQKILQALATRLESGVRLVRLRAPSLPLSERLLLSCTIAEQLKSRGGLLIVGPEEWQEGASQYAKGIQLNRHQLSALASESEGAKRVERLRREGCCWLAASTHNREELVQAQRLGCDFATLSPYQKTESHPGAEVLGDEKARSLLKGAQLPVFLLGGVNEQQLMAVRRLGAQGVAGIRSVGLRSACTELDQ